MDPELYRGLLRNYFPAFIQRSFRQLNPGIQYHHNWHIDVMAAAFEDGVQGRQTRLIINVPPRSLKSHNRDFEILGPRSGNGLLRLRIADVEVGYLWGVAHPALDLDLDAGRLNRSIREDGAMCHLRRHGFVSMNRLSSSRSTHQIRPTLKAAADGISPLSSIRYTVNRLRRRYFAASSTVPNLVSRGVFPPHEMTSST
jgi:hypothetical protein